MSLPHVFIYIYICICGIIYSYGHIFLIYPYCLHPQPRGPQRLHPVPPAFYKRRAFQWDESHGKKIGEARAKCLRYFHYTVSSQCIFYAVYLDFFVLSIYPTYSHYILYVFTIYPATTVFIHSNYRRFLGRLPGSGWLLAQVAASSAKVKWSPARASTSRWKFPILPDGMWKRYKMWKLYGAGPSTFPVSNICDCSKITLHPKCPPPPHFAWAGLFLILSFLGAPSISVLSRDPSF